MASAIDSDHIKQIFHAALECKTGERDSFVASACAGNAILKTEVESLLLPFIQHQGFLKTPAFDLSAVDVAAEVLDDDPSLTNQFIGPYRLLHQLGRGGMGSVYLAKRDDGQYDQQVALKLIKRGMDSEELIRRFRRERQILANLAHPNISRLLDGGITADGRPFFVMEYVDGEPIVEYVRRERLSTTARLRLFLDVCTAVEYAHRLRIIHRDVKPGNILVGSDGVPKLLDFGIAKLLQDDQPNQSVATATALRLLTPEYASPEQLRGSPLTPASDVYSLGVVLYELLTGVRPYSLKHRTADEILQAVLNSAPERPSIVISREESLSFRSETIDGDETPKVNSRDIEPPDKLRRLLRGDLDTIALMALRKEPDRRYASVDQFAEDLRRHLEGRPILARGDSITYRTARFLKRHQTSSVSMAVIAVLCLFLGMVVTTFTNRVPQRQSIAVLPFANSGQDPEHLSGMFTDSLIDSFSRLPRLAVPARNSVLRFKGQTNDAQMLGRSLGVETILNGNVAAEGETISVNISLVDTGTNQVLLSRSYQRKTHEIQSLKDEIVLDVSQKLGLTLTKQESDRSARRYTENSEAYLLYLKGRYFWNKRDGESVKKGLEYFSEAVKRDPNFALAYSGMADCYVMLVIYGSLKDGFPPARAAATNALALDSTLGEAHTSMAMLKWLQDWNWAEADREFQAALELSPKYATAYHWYGLFLAETGRPDEALPHIRKALESDPLSLSINADLGRVLYFARRYDESLEQYQKTLEMDPNFLGAKSDVLPLYELKGMREEWFSVMERLNWNDEPDLKHAYIKGGMRAFWIRRLKNRSTSYLVKAEIYTRLGEKDRAFEELNTAITTRQFGVAQVTVDPILDSLRLDPRFDDLLHRLGLPRRTT